MIRTFYVLYVFNSSLRKKLEINWFYVGSNGTSFSYLFVMHENSLIKSQRNEADIAFSNLAFSPLLAWFSTYTVFCVKTSESQSNNYCKLLLECYFAAVVIFTHQWFHEI